MKSKLSILVFLIFNTSVFAQSYKPLLDNINEWHFTTCFSGCLTDAYYTDGDTIVNGKNYKILDGYHYISRTFLLREDIATQKVYIKFATSEPSDEYLLYDFSLSEGDVFDMKNPVTPFPRDGGLFVVDSIIARPLQDGNNYKHYYFSPAPGNTTSNNNAIWVEGVGSLSLINAPGGKPNINEVGELSCFFKDTEVFYANLDSIQDCIPIHLGVTKNYLEEVVVTKQLNSNTCILSNTQNVKSVKVFDLSGKLLSNINNNGNGSITVDLSAYQNGLYVLLANGFGDTKKSFKVLK